MRKIFIFTALLLCFAACKTPKKVVDTAQTELRDNSRLDIEQSHVAAEQSAGTVTVVVAEDETTVEETTTVNYDTSQPTDPATGRPPVQSETITRKTTGKGKQTQKETVNNSTSIVQDSLRDRSKLDREEVVEVTHSETPKYPVLKYLFYILLILAISAGAWWLNRKFSWVKLF